ncbi:MAG: protoporphyrinogen oxidase [Pirellulaceae bacterium]
MSASTSSVRRIAVIGGGFSGLAAAHRLRELAPDAEVVLLEQSDRVGGVVRTEEADGFLFEHGADMFTTKEPWALGVCRRIGFDGELINTNAQHARAFVVRRGRLYPVPEGFTLMTPGRMWPIARSPLLSLAGKLRMAGEYFVPPRQETEDESLQQFVTRRLGREAYERLVQPLIGGIYTADPTKLSMQAALPQFIEMERKHGSLIRAIRSTKRGAGAPVEKSAGARYGLFVTPRHGMESFLQAIARRLPDGIVHLGTPVESIHRCADGRWDVAAPRLPNSGPFDAVLLATPAHHSARLLQETSPELAQELAGIPYATAAVVVVGVRREQLRHPLNGFGVVVPLTENRRVLAISLSSVKFAGRAPEGSVLMRIFVGGACQEHLAELPEPELEQLALGELRDLLGLTGTPQLVRIVRWRRAMPQYHVGHLDRMRRIERLLEGFPTLALAGNAYRGVGIPFCIRGGESAAEKLVGTSDWRDSQAATHSRQ